MTGTWCYRLASLQFWGRNRQRAALTRCLRKPLQMSRSRLVGVAGTTFALAMTAAAMMAFAGDAASHPRDEQTFLTYVSHTGDDMATAGGADATSHDADYHWAAQHPTRMLAEGDRACEWLSRQPDAPDVAPDRSYEADTLVARYLDTAHLRRRVDQTYMAQTYLVAGAWAFLCRDTRSTKTAPTRADED